MFLRKVYRAGGFTIVEVLITTVMVAILASLVVPRFINQNEKAIASEAVAIMGAIKRAEYQFRDESPTNAFFDFADQCTAANLIAIPNNLGLNLADTCGVPGVPRRWTYQVAGGVIFAFRGIAVGPNFISQDLTTGVWNGAGTFAPGTANWPNLL